MSINKLFAKLLIIVTVNDIVRSEEITSNTSEANYPTSSTKSFPEQQIPNITVYTDEQEWKLNDSNDNFQRELKLPEINLAILNKYRRYGVDGSPETWENEYQSRRLTNSKYSEHNKYNDNNFHNDNRDKNRFSENVYPVQVQGCSQYLREAPQNKDESSIPQIRDGILQGWIGGMWQNNKNNDNKNFIMSPFYSTTASAKIPSSSHRNRDNYYGTNYDKALSGLSSNSKFYNSEHKVHDSNSRDMFNRNNNYIDTTKNIFPWRPSTTGYQDKNRIIYYDYNLDNIRRPANPFISQGNNKYCPYAEYHTCEQELRRLQFLLRNQYNRQPYYPPLNIYSQGKSLSEHNEENPEQLFPSYANGDIFQNKDRYNDDQNLDITQSTGFLDRQRLGVMPSQPSHFHDRHFMNESNDPVQNAILSHS